MIPANVVFVASPTVKLPAVPLKSPITTEAVLLALVRDPIVSEPPDKSKIPVPAIVTEALLFITSVNVVVPDCSLAPVLIATLETELNALLALRFVLPVLAVKMPENVFAPDKVKSPVPEPDFVKFLLPPLMIELMVMPPVPSIAIMFSVEFPNPMVKSRELPLVIV